MSPEIIPIHDLSPTDIDVIEDHLYEHNRQETGRSDARGLAFAIRDKPGHFIGVAAGYSWAGIAELKQMWVADAWRGRGYARSLVNALTAEASNVASSESGWRAMTSKLR